MTDFPPFKPHEMTGLVVSRRGTTTTLAFDGPNGRTAKHVHAHPSEADAIQTMSLFAQYVAIVFRPADTTAEPERRRSPTHAEGRIK